MFYTHALLLLPLLTGVFSAFICRYEHIHGGWKQLLALPVSRSSVYLVKLIVVMWLLAAVQLLTAASLYAAGLIQGVEESFPWSSVLINIAAGWAACLPLAALQLAVSTAWSSFAAPLAVNVIFTLPNLLVAHSRDYGLLSMGPAAAGHDARAFGDWRLYGSAADPLYSGAGQLRYFSGGRVGLFYTQSHLIFRPGSL